MKKLLASAAIAAVMTIGGGSLAHATVYNLTANGSMPAGNYGTVTVTGSGTSQIDFDIELNPGVFFFQSGGGGADFFFDLVGNPQINLTGIDPKFSAVTPQSAGSDNAPPFGHWDYEVDWLGPPTNGSNLPSGGIQSLTFSVTKVGGGNITLDSGLQQGTSAPPIWAVVDVATGCGTGPTSGCPTTGQVGAVLGGGVPEPATWAMMLTGFFGMGSLLRKRRALVLA